MWDLHQNHHRPSQPYKLNFLNQYHKATPANPSTNLRKSQKAISEKYTFYLTPPSMQFDQNTMHVTNRTRSNLSEDYLSWEVMIRLLREMIIIRRQMRHDIMLVCNPDCIRNEFTIVGCKSCITNSRLSKCYSLNIFLSNIDLAMSRENFD